MGYRQTELSSMAQIDAAKTGIDSEGDWKCLVVHGFRAYPRTGLTGDGLIHNTFSQTLTLAEADRQKVLCRHCHNAEVEQRPSAFYAITSRRSA
jgi:hypothetical protein